MTSTVEDASPSTARPSRLPEVERAARVWLVDDSADQRALARQALASQFEVSELCSGGELAEQLASSSSPPDVLVLGWHMPELSGAELCRFVRGTLDAAQLPILVLTATSTREAVIEALSAGANDFVRAPFSDEELSARVAALARTRFLCLQMTSMENRLRVEAEFRERFIGMLAHDLRQPLNTIFMATHVQLRGGPDSSRFADLQLRAAERMRRMIGELLDFTRNRPDTGIPMQGAPTDFAELLSASVAEIRVAYPEASVQLSLRGPCSGHWDPDRLAQVCSNLIGNAIEHSVAGTPVEVSLDGDGAEAVTLRVSNRGSAIPPEVLANIFEPFRRGAGKRSRGGVGLGLHIVSQIVSSHGGQIDVQSDEEGTHFRVKLPRDGA